MKTQKNPTVTVMSHMLFRILTKFEALCKLGIYNIQFALFHIFNIYPANIYLLKLNNRNKRKKGWNMFKINNKDTQMLLLNDTSLMLKFEHFPPFRRVSIVDFEHIFASWVY